MLKEKVIFFYILFIFFILVSPTSLYAQQYRSEASVSTNVGTPPVAGGNPPPNGDYCNAGYLANFFGQDQGNNASCICQNESGGNPFAPNLSCLKPGGSADYSIGLFQINLISHCNNAVCYYDNNVCNEYPTYSGEVCKILNNANLNACVSQYDNANNNLTTAAQLYKAHGWQPWGTSAHKCNIPGF